MKSLSFSITATVLAVMSLPIDFGASTHTSFTKPAFAQSQAEVAERVREIQIALKHFGFYRGRVDGVMGPGTINGLNKFATEAKAKGLTKSTGAITAADIDVLLNQYERSVAKSNKTRTQTANSGSNNGSRNGGGASATAGSGSASASSGGSAVSSGGSASSVNASENSSSTGSSESSGGSGSRGSSAGSSGASSGGSGASAGSSGAVSASSN